MSAPMRLSCLLVLLLSFAGRAWAQSSVLIIWDDNNADTQSLMTALQGAGLTVTLSDTAETGYDGTNPPLGVFDAVIHLNGTTYSADMPIDGQDALVDFVEHGGGYIHSEWSAYEFSYGRMQNMRDLIIVDRSGGGTGAVTYNVVPGKQGHDVLASIPSSMSINAGYNEGFAHSFGVDEPEVLMTDGSGYHAVVVREWGFGRVVGFSHAGNYQSLGALLDANVQQLFINASIWAGTASMKCPSRLGRKFHPTSRWLVSE